MDRRKLLKLFGIGAAAGVAAPVLTKWKSCEATPQHAAENARDKATMLMQAQLKAAQNACNPPMLVGPPQSLSGDGVWVHPPLRDDFFQQIEQYYSPKR